MKKNASAEMFSPSVSPSAARDAEVKKSVEMALQDFTPKNGIADSVIDEEAVAEPQSIMEVSTITEEPPTIQRRVSSKQRKLSLEEYRNAYLRVPIIIDRKPVFVSSEVIFRDAEKCRRGRHCTRKTSLHSRVEAIRSRWSQIVKCRIENQ